ncbi:hypothetical protein BGZ49_010416 [Haplosporangium sp. Z 27]|nr:hypothetical protein BGZ49_010416 [Haplosporangium sp. Z 27]
MDASVKRNNFQLIPQVSVEDAGNQQKEILPDTIVGILLRMQEEFKCSICLNKVDHLERLIESFLKLKSAFEREEGFTLSQAPIRYNAEPLDNLSQLFPYPEKPGEASSGGLDTREQIQSVHNPTLQHNDVDTIEASLNSKEPEDVLISSQAVENQHTDPGSGLNIDIDCFDVNLDTISAQEAALLAESMMSMMSSVTLNDMFLPSAQANVQNKSRSHSVSRQPDLSKVKLEDKDDRSLLTPSPDLQVSLVEPKLETSLDLQDTEFADCCPTQEPLSKETNVIICGTFLSSTKKQQMESTAKALKSRTSDDLLTRPTHVVMDITKAQSQNGSGRTVKYFLGVLRSCWVLRFEWITASMSAGYWVEETSYQIHDNEFGCNAPKLSRASHLRGDPPLFAGYEIQISGVFTKPTKEEVELMIRAGGGTVVPQLFLRDTRLAKSIASQRSNDQTSDQKDSNPVRHLLLYEANGGVMSLKKLKTDIQMVRELAQSYGKHVEVTQCKVLLDCISQYDMSSLDNNSNNNNL